MSGHISSGMMDLEVSPAINNRGLIVRFFVEKTFFTAKEIIERAATVASLERRQSPTDEELSRLRSLKALGEYVEQELVELRQIGNAYQTAVSPVDDAIKARFSREYEAFKNNDDPAVCGTRLADWGLLPRKIADELIDSGVETIEQLAGIADAELGGFLPYNNGRRWRDEAIRHLDEHGGRLAEMSAAFAAQMKETIALKARIEELESKGKKHG